MDVTAKGDSSGYSRLNRDRGGVNCGPDSRVPKVHVLVPSFPHVDEGLLQTLRFKVCSCDQREILERRARWEKAAEVAENCKDIWQANALTSESAGSTLCHPGKTRLSRPLLLGTMGGFYGCESLYRPGWSAFAGRWRAGLAQ